MDRPTYLCIEDIPDTPNPDIPRDIEKEQADRMRDILGVPLWDFITGETEKWKKIVTGNSST